MLHDAGEVTDSNDACTLMCLFNAYTIVPASLVMCTMASLHTFEVASHHGKPPLSHCSKAKNLVIITR